MLKLTKNGFHLCVVLILLGLGYGCASLPDNVVRYAGETYAPTEIKNVEDLALSRLEYWKTRLDNDMRVNEFEKEVHKEVRKMLEKRGYKFIGVLIIDSIYGSVSDDVVINSEAANRGANIYWGYEVDAYEVDAYTVGGGHEYIERFRRKYVLYKCMDTKRCGDGFLYDEKFEYFKKELTGESKAADEMIKAASEAVRRSLKKTGIPNELSLITLDGRKISYGTDLKGKKPVFLYFWSIWGGALTNKELRTLSVRAKELGDKVQVIAVNRGERRSGVLRYITSRGLKLTIALDEDNKIAKLFDVYKRESAFVLIDKKGVVVCITDWGWRNDPVPSCVDTLNNKYLK